MRGLYENIQNNYVRVLKLRVRQASNSMKGKIMTQIDFSPEELSAFREELFLGFTDSQFNLAITECKRRNLVPGQHVFFQLRNSSEWNSDIGAKVSTKKLTRVTTIDAFRLISQRTGEYIGQGKGRFYYLDADNNPTIVSEIPLPHPTLPNTPREPWAASIPIYRKGFQEPVEVVCRFDAYAVTRKSGQNVVLTDQWVRRGPEQLLKCSEAASRRACFPEELGSMYLSEEFAREDAENKPETPVAEPQPITEAPKAAIVPTVNHAPAVPTSEPRPGEEKPRAKKPAKDVKIEEVILDKVEVVAADNPKIDKTEPTVQPEIAEPVQKMDNPKPSSDRCRDLIAAGVQKDALKAHILSVAVAVDTKSVTPAKWNAILTPIETLLAKEGKDAVNTFITAKPEPKDDRADDWDNGGGFDVAGK